MNPWVELCMAIYRRLARAFPQEFWMVYGEDLERMGSDALPEIWRRYGFSGLFRLLTDIALRLPAEYASEARKDTAYVVRTLAKSPGYAAIGIVSLGLGIGVCTVFYSELNSIVLHPAASPQDPESVVALGRLVSYPYFERYRDRHDVAASAMAFQGPLPFGVIAADAGTESERVFGDLVSLEYFSTLALKPILGRFFDANTERAGSAPVAVISEHYWRERMQSDPKVLGRTLRLNGQFVTIIGVGPEGFRGVWPITPADVFLPVTSAASITPEFSAEALHQPDLQVFHVVLRLNKGMKAAVAQGALSATTHQLFEEYSVAERDRRDREVRLISADGVAPLPASVRRLLFTLGTVLMGLILSLVCTNLANLMLARCIQRRKEIAIRLSVGASRSRLVRQFLTESVILSVAGALAGFLFAYWLTGVISSIRIPNLALDVYVDKHVLLFSLAVALVTGIGFGVAPAMAVTRAELGLALREGASTALRGYRRFGLRNLLVVYQVAASLALLLVTGFLILGYANMTDIDPGYDTANLYLFQLDPLHDGYSRGEAVDLFERLPETLSRLSSVSGATLSSGSEFQMEMPSNTRLFAPDPNGNVQVNVVGQPISPHYFATLGVPVLQGREFEEHETGVNPIILNQKAAQAFFGSRNPLGQTLRRDSSTYLVIGVVKDSNSGLLVKSTLPTGYFPASERDLGQTATLVVRGRARSDVAAAVRREIAAIDSRLTVFNVRTVRDDIQEYRSMLKFGTSFYSGIGVFGLILASIGLAGVTAYAVARRSKEIGIRMALGARTAQVLALVMKEGITMVTIGAILGFTGATVLSRALSSLTEEFARVRGQTTGNPVLLIGAPLMLAGVALLACYLPARRLTRVDPLSALRED